MKVCALAEYAVLVLLSVGAAIVVPVTAIGRLSAPTEPSAQA